MGTETSQGIGQSSGRDQPTIAQGYSLRHRPAFAFTYHICTSRADFRRLRNGPSARTRLGQELKKEVSAFDTLGKVSLIADHLSVVVACCSTQRSLGG